MPEAVRAALQASAPEALKVEDADADPWDIGALDAEPMEVPAAAAPRPAVKAGLPKSVPPAVVAAGAVRQAGVSARAETPAPAAVPQAFGSGVDLARLVSSRMPVAWFEAVAIAQELLAVLTARRPAGRAIDLEPGAVAITFDGRVELGRDVPAGVPPVAHAARILLALLGDHQTPPVQLRLLALQEVSPEPECATLSEFSTRLALFERPDRRTAIRGVYERFQSLPRQPEAARAPVAAHAAPEAVPGLGDWLRRVPLAAVAVMLTVLAVGTTAAWLWRPMSAPARAPASAAAETSNGSPRQSAAPASAWESAAAVWKSVARRFGLAPSAPAATAPPAQPVVIPAEARTPVPRSQRARPAAAPMAPAAGPAPGAARAAASPAPAVAAVPDTAIYAAADTDVVPPLPLRSRLPADSQAGSGSGSGAEIELLVSPAGEVELVKLLTPQAGVRSSMMLSAVKTWRFTPATRDGRPVRYRLVMRLPSQ